MTSSTALLSTRQPWQPQQLSILTDDPICCPWCSRHVKRCLNNIATLPYIRLLASTAAVMWKGGRTNDIALPTSPLQWHLWKGESVSFCPSCANYMRPKHLIIPFLLKGNTSLQVFVTNIFSHYVVFSWQQQKRGHIWYLVLEFLPRDPTHVLCILCPLI